MSVQWYFYATKYYFANLCEYKQYSLEILAEKQQNQGITLPPNPTYPIIGVQSTQPFLHLIALSRVYSKTI